MKFRLMLNGGGKGGKKETVTSNLIGMQIISRRDEDLLPSTLGRNFNTPLDPHKEAINMQVS